ncbi:Transposon TX1 uncharacterized 149 kDa protein [Exaiptasia diaphana]|nr:Transposon TX1 uncharacterized 149 kDa protein [Exaiptasia diaphana]
MKLVRLESLDTSKEAVLYFYNVLKPNQITINTNLYSASRDIKSGPSSGSFNFTIKDMANQINNDGGSLYNPLSKDYLYRLIIKVVTTDDVLHTSDSKLFFFAGLEVPTLDDEQRKRCEGFLSIEECYNALKQMKNSKTPGNDGLSKEFYTCMWDEIKEDLVSSLNNGFEKKEELLKNKLLLIY